MAAPKQEGPPRGPAQGPHVAENGAVTPDGGSSPGGALVSRVDGCVLPYLGGFGRYQKQLVLLTWIPALFIGFSEMSDLFLLAQPGRTVCRPPPGTHGTELPVPPPSPTTSSAAYAVSMVTPRRPLGQWNENGTGTENGTHSDYQTFCECNSSTWRHELRSGLSSNVVTQWNLVCDSAWQVHIAKFSLLVGSIFGFLVLGVLADWFGRHPVLIVSVFFTLVFGLAVAFSVNVTMFSTLRFFEGFWLAGIILSLYVLRIELCLPGWRFSMTMVANFVVLAGKLLMPAVAILCSDWQILQAIIVCPLFLMLFYIWLFPESLRWLLATHQYSRSKWLIESIAKKNNTNQDSHELISELNRVLERQPKKTCIVKMVGTRNLWKNIVVLCVNSLTGYGIHHCFARSMMEHIIMFHDFSTEYYTMMGIAVATGLALCPAVGIMGRRGGLLLFMIITALASLLQLGLPNLLGKYSTHLNIESNELNSTFSKAFSVIGMFSSQAVSDLSIFFCAEITPTVIRGGGMGLVLASARFGMLTAPIMDLHNQKGYFLHHVIFACCTLICIICILLLPESRHQPLPESLSEGEGYTRHPLLPPHKKPAEQRHLLPDTKEDGANDYANARGTPMHEVAVSTVESTASSTVAAEDEDLGNDLDAVRLSVLKHRHDSSPTRTDSLPGLVVQPPLPDTSETPPPIQSEINSSDSLDTPDSPGQVVADPLTPPHAHPATSPTASPPVDSDPVLLQSSSPVEPQAPEDASVPSLEQTLPDAAPLFRMDSTVSSPIDSAVDCTISPVNGGSSS